ncbi:MAG: hypothetical protein GY845_25600 [Planctomycetes bacterium]|nr:hypothetical protein [Planctomycetota bacterium]
MPQTPATSITATTMRRVMDTVIDKRVSPDKTLTRLMFPEETKRNLTEESVQVDVKSGTWKMAPFNLKGQPPYIMAGHSGTSYMLATPYINIERPLQHTSQLISRQPGGVVFSEAGNNYYMEAIADALTEDAMTLGYAIDSRVEWMVAELIQGEITYNVAGQDSFTIETGKPAANTFTAAVLWSNASATPFVDINEVLKVINTANGPTPNIAILGSNAADALMALLETGKITAIITDSGINAGNAALGTAIGDDRLQYIGTFGAAMIPFYAYRGTYIADDGVTVTDLIRTDYVEFFNRNNAVAQRRLNYGRIPTLYAEMEGRAVTSRLIDIVEPTVKRDNYETIYKSRPLPWFYRPEDYVSLKVT